MPAGANATKLSDLFDPQVVADYIDQKLIDAIRLSPLARIDYTLVGRPGDTVTMPYYAYVGDAEAVAEGADIPIAKLTQSTKTVTISKIGRAVEFTDEALLSGYNNDIAEEAARQVVTAINSKVEADLISQMATDSVLTHTVESAADPSEGIADALTLFKEDIDGDKVIVIPPSFYASLRKSKAWIPNTEMGAAAIIRGTVGMVHGCQIVVSNRMSVATSGTSGDVNKNTAYIVKPGALALFLKRDTMVEFDRDKIAQSNFIIASKLFAPYVYDANKLIKVTLPDT